MKAVELDYGRGLYEVIYLRYDVGTLEHPSHATTSENAEACFYRGLEIGIRIA